MKQNFTRILLTICFLSSTPFMFSQTKKEVNDITKNYDLNKLKSLSKQYEKSFYKEKQKALEMATIKGWRIKYTDDKGSNYELMKVDERGEPIYYQTHNSDAALSTRTNFLHNGGGLGLNIEGQGMIAYVWDQGLARSTHQEYDGIGGENRFSIGDGTTTLNFHGAHVTGTIIASGVDPEAKGMAPQAKAIGHDWNNDDSEITAAAANGMLLSNHSYGVPPDGTGVPDWLMGAYSSGSRTMDEIMYNAPYYLNVTSAGNSGNDNTSNGNPLEGNSTFDKLTVWGTSKNNLVIGNAQDATIDASTGNLLSVVINSGSSEGPTDDLRIKPDIAGNGTSLLSTYESSDNAYARISGTSMSSPNVMGSLLLLQQYYNSLYGSFMKSATLKGLALHTADDQGLTGPDAVWGWGLLNTKKAAETINNSGLTSEIKELELSEGETYTYTVTSDTTNPLIASISWTDLPGNIASGTANDGTPVLVNDLDIRVTQNSNTFEPWKLTGVNSNIKGDNTVDPYERIEIDGASGEYTITVTHKGTLSGGPQKFSLVVTGIDSDFRITTSSTSLTQCSNLDAVYNFNYEQLQNTTTSFSIQNLPTGLSSSFSLNSLSASGNFSLTISDLDNVDAGTYQFNVVADNGEETETKTVELIVFKTSFSDYPISIISPVNQEREILFPEIDLLWNENINAESYYVEISENPSFTNIVSSGMKSEPSFTTNNLSINTIYYWRVKPSNRCADGDFSETFSFQTLGGENCDNTYTARTFTNAQISSTGDNPAYVGINISDNLLISRLIVNTTITHTAVNELTVFLQEPSSLGSNNTFLLEQACNDLDNISNVTFDDTGSVLACGTSDPAISGTIIPTESLRSSIGKMSQGTWFLAASYNSASVETGQIDDVSITVCTSEANTSTPVFVNNGINVVANGSYTFQTTDIEASSTTETAAQQLYTIIALPSVGNIILNSTNVSIGDTFTQEDVNLGNVAFINTETALFSDSFKVDITNAINGWLPNQNISLVATSLSSPSFDLANFSVYPNPSNGVINVKFQTENNTRISLELFDLTGRRVYNSIFESAETVFDNSVNIGNVANGIYLLKATQGNRSTTKRIIISK